MYLVQISIASSSKNFNFITLRKCFKIFFFTDNDKNKMKNKIHMYLHLLYVNHCLLAALRIKEKYILKNMQKILSV